MLKRRSKHKLAKLLPIDAPATYLAPQGRAPQQILVEEAHSCGEHIASTKTKLICPPPIGEVGTALLTGALSMGGDATIYSDLSRADATIPEGAVVKECDQDCVAEVLASVGHIWVMPPAFADLERYLELWIASGFKPLVCISPRDEFLLLRGFVQEIVSAGSPRIAERLIFSRTPEEGWESLSELLA